MLRTSARCPSVRLPNPNRHQFIPSARLVPEWGLARRCNLWRRSGRAGLLSRVTLSPCVGHLRHAELERGVSQQTDADHHRPQVAHCAILVPQWTGSSEDDFEALVRMEDGVSGVLGHLATVDGHDFGSGEMNIFIGTDHPALAFSEAQTTLSHHQRWAEVRAAYREPPGDRYTVLWPTGLVEFSIK